MENVAEPLLIVEEHIAQASTPDAVSEGHAIEQQPNPDTQVLQENQSPPEINQQDEDSELEEEAQSDDGYQMDQEEQSDDENLIEEETPMDVDDESEEGEDDPVPPSPASSSSSRVLTTATTRLNARRATSPPPDQAVKPHKRRRVSNEPPRTSTSNRHTFAIRLASEWAKAIRAYIRMADGTRPERGLSEAQQVWLKMKWAMGEVNEAKMNISQKVVTVSGVGKAMRRFAKLEPLLEWQNIEPAHKRIPIRPTPILECWKERFLLRNSAGSLTGTDDDRTHSSRQPSAATD